MIRRAGTLGDVSGLQLIHGECLEEMSKLPDLSIDLILCDLPYGVTQNEWDRVISFAPLWQQYHRLCKGAIVLTAIQPFTSTLVLSNLTEFRYDWVWEKTNPTGFLSAKRRPLRAHESVLVFGNTSYCYNPQKTTGHPRKTATRRRDITTNYGKQEFTSLVYDSTDRYPRSVQVFPMDKQISALHPNQKPVALMEYLVRTYTDEGMTVLDNCMGSGTAGVACLNTKRKFIGIEGDGVYFGRAEARIQSRLAFLHETM